MAFLLPKNECFLYFSVYLQGHYRLGMFGMDVVILPRILMFQSKMKNTSFKQNFGIMNHSLHGIYPLAGKFEIPQIKPYHGEIPDSLVSFSDIMGKRKDDSAVHFYVDDCVLQRLWNHPDRYLGRIAEHGCTLGPDFSMFTDLPLGFNLWNLLRYRYLALAMQEHGIGVIPSANWGNYDSLDYCFDGLPQGGAIAINHSVIGRTQVQRQLFRVGVERLITTKHPDLLLVYGFELPFDPGVAVRYYESRIQKLRRYGKTKENRR